MKSTCNCKECDGTGIIESLVYACADDPRCGCNENHIHAF